MVVIDHFLRGIFWPQSIFGLLAVENWRWLEHGGWVVFEDVFLLWACSQGVQQICAPLPSTKRMYEASEGECRGGEGCPTRTAELRISEGPGRCLLEVAPESEFPRQHEARDPHAHERNPRYDRSRPRHRI